MNSREVIPTGAVLTKNGDIVDQHDSLLNVDIYGPSNEETYLPKTVAIIVTYDPGLGNLAGKLCAINLKKHQHESRFSIIMAIIEIFIHIIPEFIEVTSRILFLILELLANKS